MDDKLIYFGDPMCSWCYGFAPHISEVKEHFREILDFKLVMGGLRPGGQETMGEIGAFLQHHWQEVNSRSGQPFNYKILKNSNFVYDTEPPCRAVVSMRILDPKQEFDFYKTIQESFYQKGANTNDAETYFHSAVDFGVSENDFKKVFEDKSTIEKTREDFLMAQQYGVRGFPTTILFFNQKYYILAAGYSESGVMIQNIESVMTPEDLS